MPLFLSGVGTVYPGRVVLCSLSSDWGFMVSEKPSRLEGQRRQRSRTTRRLASEGWSNTIIRPLQVKPMAAPWFSTHVGYCFQKHMTLSRGNSEANDAIRTHAPSSGKARKIANKIRKTWNGTWWLETNKKHGEAKVCTVTTV